MKDSGIEWIGEIPEHWNVTRIGSLYKLRSLKVSDRDYPPLSVTKSGILPQIENVSKTDAHDDRKLVKCGDFVINSRSDRRNSCGISKYDGSVSLINIILYPVAEINSAYYNLLFDTREFADEFYKWGHGIVDDLWTTTWQDMKKIKIIVPPIEEQQKIARFLDEKCGYIDNITELLKKQIELLADYKKSLITETVTQGFNKNVNMKDSGVNYIGKMPVDWKLTKLKYICKKLNRNFDSFAEHLICSNGGKVIKRDINNNIGLISDNEKMYQGVQKGDLLIHGMDTWHGAIAISEYNGKCTNVVHVCNSEENKHFICYFLQMLAFRNVYKSLCNGVRENTSDFRSWEKTGNIYITLPPAEEQEEISAFLDKKCENIDNIISAKKQQLQIMEDYKKSLVYECVTGKRKV